jgi:hypothetical protein
LRRKEAVKVVRFFHRPPPSPRFAFAAKRERTRTEQRERGTPDMQHKTYPFESKSLQVGSSNPKEGTLGFNRTKVEFDKFLSEPPNGPIQIKNSRPRVGDDSFCSSNKTWKCKLPIAIYPMARSAAAVEAKPRAPVAEAEVEPRASVVEAEVEPGGAVDSKRSASFS